MDDSTQLDDPPISWPRNLPQLKNLDDRLRCSICYEHMKNPVISTGCTHSFCSLCIRNYIAFKNACPICFGEITDGMLRSYRCMEEIIKCFLAIKTYVLKQTESGDMQPGKSAVVPQMHTIVNTEQDDQTPDLGSPTSISPVLSSQYKASIEARRKGVAGRSCSTADSSTLAQPSSNIKRVEKQLFQSPIKAIPKPQTQKKTAPSQISSVPATSSQQSNEVECPVCQVKMKESVINSHLDSCLTKQKEKRKPLPKLIYNLMKDAELKKRLRELELSTIGDKSTLINRHKKYTILYNSECDSATPRPIAELKAQLEREEAESRRLALAEPRLTSPRVKKTDPQTIEKENNQYLKSNKDSFDQLIQDVRRRQQQAKAQAQQQKPPTKEEPDERKTELSYPATPSTSVQEAPVERVASPAPNEDDDEITVLPTPVKTYETVSLVDSDQDEPSVSNDFTSVRKRILSECASSSITSSITSSNDSNDAFPDPMATTSGSTTPKWTDSSNTAWSPLSETLTNDCRETNEELANSSRRRISDTPKSPSYSPLDDNSPDWFKPESTSSSGSSTPVSSDSRRSLKRNKSQMDGSSEKRKSSRRRI